MENFNILFFPWRDWNSIKIEGFRTREANILKEMIKNPKINTIICINRSKQPSYINMLLKMINKHYIYEKKNDNINLYKERIIYKKFFSSLVKLNKKLFVLNISYYLPNPKGNKLERISIFNHILEKQIKYALNYIGINKYLTWCSDLTRVKVAKKFKNKLMIFDSIDNLLEHDQNKRDFNFIQKMYKFTSKHSDIIFTVSKNLKEELFGNKSNVYYIPNGINFELYKRNDSSCPKDLPKNKPIIGYVGLMQERIDVELLTEVVEKNKDYNFVFIGPILTPKYFVKLKQYKNVFFLGPKHHEYIPQYIKCFDVCIIPHKVNRFTMSMNPLKLYEYLAAGKEVITTPVPPSDEFKDIIHIERNSDGFTEKINQCIYRPFSDFNKKDIYEKIKSHSWNSRLEKMLELINEYI